MQSYSLLAPAKINLYLEILGDRPDGFHELVMIMQGIELADRLQISANSTDLIRIFCQTPGVPTDEKNLAYKAAQLMKSKFPQVAANYGGVDIKIEKTIPVAAGLAGGSTDSAAVLVGLDLMWKLGLTQPELQELGALLGSDVPFCLTGGTAIATGRGEILDPIQDLDDLWVVLAKYRNLSISTAWAYQTYRQNFQSSYISEQAKVKDRTARVRSGNLVKAIAQKDPEAIGKYLYNDLEKVVLPIYEPVANLKKAFAQTDILGTLMSGSGPTVFALCATKAQAEASREATAKIMANPNLDFWVTKLSSTGIQIGG